MSQWPTSCVTVSPWSYLPAYFVVVPGIVSQSKTTPSRYAWPGFVVMLGK